MKVLVKVYSKASNRRMEFHHCDGMYEDLELARQAVLIALEDDEVGRVASVVIVHPEEQT